MKAIRFRPNLLAEIRALPRDERREIGKRISEAQEFIGQPHLHKGVGIRKLRDDYFEIRVGRSRRLVFEHTTEALVVELMGNHNDVKRFLKSL